MACRSLSCQNLCRPKANLSSHIEDYKTLLKQSQALVISEALLIHCHTVLIYVHQIQVVLHMLLLLDLAQVQAAKSTAPDAAGVSPVHRLVGLTLVVFGSPHVPTMPFYVLLRSIRPWLSNLLKWDKMGTISYKDSFENHDDWS